MREYASCAHTSVTVGHRANKIMCNVSAKACTDGKIDTVSKDSGNDQVDQVGFWSGFTNILHQNLHVMGITVTTLYLK
jgi:hypothetical protein